MNIPQCAPLPPLKPQWTHSPSGGVQGQTGGPLHVVGEDIALEARVGDEEVDASGVLVSDVEVAGQPIPGQADGQSQTLQRQLRHSPATAQRGFVHLPDRSEEKVVAVTSMSQTREVVSQEIALQSL